MGCSASSSQQHPVEPNLVKPNLEQPNVAEPTPNLEQPILEQHPVEPSTYVSVEAPAKSKVESSALNGHGWSAPVKSEKECSSANGHSWSQGAADALQSAVDRIFGSSGRSLLGLDFSFSIADPLLDGCPLIGCSTGFTKLCGYDLQEIVGRNCRFLVDSVPVTMINHSMRKQCKDFCEAVRKGQEYRRPADCFEQWMPLERPPDELLAMQMNARKDGTLFNNMFFMKALDLASELGSERPYIVALQTELKEGEEDLAKLIGSLEQLDINMAKVRSQLERMFYLRSKISRLQHSVVTSGPIDQKESLASEGPIDQEEAAFSCAPANLHLVFSSAEVQRWEGNRFKRVRKLADATRNKGAVWLMQDQKSDRLEAVKQMPNSWVQKCHEEFCRFNPNESEVPWVDIGCTRYLNSVNYKYACSLQGVYRDDQDTFVVSSFVSKGDLFTAANKGEDPGPARESAFAPLIIELFRAVQLLHNMQIVHRDISLENILWVTGEGREPSIKIIDYGMASTNRNFQSCPRGKASYEAPEMNSNGGDYDAFLSDVFAAGVSVYALLLKDYPWGSTKPGRCKCFDFVSQHGLQTYCAKRCARGSDRRMSDLISRPLMQLLEGMLAIDPKQRLTLGEKHWVGRKSVWDTTWVTTMV